MSKLTGDYPTLEEIQEVIEDGSYQGWCINCGDWTHDMAEPDAHAYECPKCGENKVFGAEELVVLGMVE